MSLNTFIRQWIIVILICITIFPVHAIPAGEEYEVVNIPVCYGEVQVKLRSQLSYLFFTFPGCDYKENNLWTCRCRNPTSIRFNSLNETRGELDLAVQYDLSQPTGTVNEQDDVRRTEQYSGLIIGEPIKPPFIWPEFNGGGFILAIIIIVGLALVVGMIYVIKLLFFTDTPKSKEEEYSDKEMEEWLNNLK